MWTESESQIMAGRQDGWMDGWYEQAGGKVIPSPDQPLVVAS